MTSGSTIITFDKQVYSIDAVQVAAYRLMNVLTVDISVRNEIIQCVIEPASVVSDDKLRTIIQDFRKEVLDHQLRLKLKEETESVRNLILGLAFSRTGLQQNGE